MPAVTFCAPLAYRPAYEAISREISLLLPAVSRAEILTVPPVRSNPLRGDRRPGIHHVHPLWLRCAVVRRKHLAGSDLLHFFATLPLPRRMRALMNAAPRPFVTTVISLGELCLADLAALQGSAAVVAECTRDEEYLRQAGLQSEELSVIIPASEIRGSEPPPTGVPLRILFASSPLQAAEFSQRGVDLLIAAARQRPDVEFRLLWRPGAANVLPRLPTLPNLQIDRTVHNDMAAVLARAHAVIAPFRHGGKSKSVPLSIVESLRCGRPVLVSDAVGLADVVTRDHCGVVFAPEEHALIAALDTLRDQYAELQAAAERIGDLYAVEPFRQAYCELYAALV